MHCCLLVSRSCRRKKLKAGPPAAFLVLPARTPQAAERNASYSKHVSFELSDLKEGRPTVIGERGRPAPTVCAPEQLQQTDTEVCAVSCRRALERYGLPTSAKARIRKQRRWGRAPGKAGLRKQSRTDKPRGHFSRRMSQKPFDDALLFCLSRSLLSGEGLLNRDSSQAEGS